MRLPDLVTLTRALPLDGFAISIEPFRISPGNLQHDVWLSRFLQNLGYTNIHAYPPRILYALLCHKQGLYE